MMVAPISIQHQREKVMDFIYPFYSDYTVVLIRMPSNQHNRTPLLMPFSRPVWLCVAASVVATSMLLACVIVVNPLENEILEEKNGSSLIAAGDEEQLIAVSAGLRAFRRYARAFHVGVWFIYGAILNQGEIREGLPRGSVVHI